MTMPLYWKCTWSTISSAGENATSVNASARDEIPDREDGPSMEGDVWHSTPQNSTRSAAITVHRWNTTVANDS